MRHGAVPMILIAVAAILIAGGLLLRAGYRHGRPQPQGLEVLYRPLRSPEDIESLSGPAVPPVTYTRGVSLADLPVDEKKQKFFDMLLPSVLIAKHKLANLRREIARIDSLSERTSEEELWLQAMLERYRAENARQLMLRLRDHPNSLVMAQAALESGWGTSRFFREGLNLFGVWSFDENEPRMPAGETRGDCRVYVKRYPSLLGSVEDYFLTLGRGPYSDFRRARTQVRDPLELAEHLENYSELGEEYVRRVALTIRSNDLDRYDAYRLDPLYRSTEGDDTPPGR